MTQSTILSIHHATPRTSASQGLIKETRTHCSQAILQCTSHATSPPPSTPNPHAQHTPAAHALHPSRAALPAVQRSSHCQTLSQLSPPCTSTQTLPQPTQPAPSCGKHALPKPGCILSSNDPVTHSTTQQRSQQAAHQPALPCPAHRTAASSEPAPALLGPGPGRRLVILLIASTLLLMSLLLLLLLLLVTVGLEVCSTPLAGPAGRGASRGMVSSCWVRVHSWQGA